MLEDRAKEMRERFQRLGLELPEDNNHVEVKDDKQFPFFDLDYDIRQLVYKELVGMHRAGVFLPGYNLRRSTLVPVNRALLASGNKKLRLEAFLVTLMDTEWDIHSGPGNAQFQDYLASITFFPITKDENLKTGFDAIHTLRFSYFSAFPYYALPSEDRNNDIHLMTLCKNLRTVITTWVTGINPASSKEEIVANYRLESMLELKELKVLHFDGWHGDMMVTLKEVGKFLKAGFQAQKQNVEVFINGDEVDKEIVVEDTVENAAVEDDGADDDDNGGW